MKERGELNGYRVVILTRVSNPHGNSEASLDRQDGYLYDEYEKLDRSFNAEIIEKYKLGESASTMDRESLDEILEMAKNDEFDILMVWAIHRLSRANAWDTFEFLLKLRKYGIIVYSDRDGYYSWEDPDDAVRLVDRVTSSREWRNEIDRGAQENNRVRLKRGEWPYGTPAYGTKKKEIKEPEEQDNELVIKDGYEWVYEKIFNEYKQGKDEEEISEHIESLIEERNEDIVPPSKHQVENILENEIFVGKLVLKRTGEEILEKEDLKQVDPELFTEVQEMRQDDASKEDQGIGPHDFPDFIYRLILRYGQEYVVDNIKSIRWCCPKCESIDLNISDTTIEYWGISLPKIYCREDNCGYQGPIIQLKELNEIDSTLPLVCSDCQRTSHFDVEPLPIDNEGDELYKFTCRHCGEFMIKDKQPNTVRRALNDQSNAIDLQENREDQGEPDGSKQGDNSSNSDSTENSSNDQTELDSYTESF